MLPGFSLLLLDLSQASHAVLISDDLKKSPRMEAAAVLGAVLSVAEVCKDLPILKPNSLNFHPVTSHPTSVSLCKERQVGISTTRTCKIL